VIFFAGGGTSESAPYT